MTRFMTRVSFFIPWKLKKTSDFIIFSGSIERDYCQRKSNQTIINYNSKKTTKTIMTKITRVKKKWKLQHHINKVWLNFGSIAEYMWGIIQGRLYHLIKLSCWLNYSSCTKDTWVVVMFSLEKSISSATRFF